MIEVSGLTKQYGSKRAVDDVSFTVQPGKVTGFLGPNGAGKSTTMRMILGLERPTAGKALVDGKPYGHLSSPLTSVGALLEARAVHPRRSGVNHLRALARTHGIPNSRVDEVIEITGLSSAAKKKVGGYSLGMGQRLGIATAILGDPSTVILDEPVNGLDPEGVIWVRQMARFLASEGKTVFLSSHLMSEMAQTADHLIVIGQGKVLADQPLQEFLNQTGEDKVLVRTDDPDGFANLLRQDQLEVQKQNDGSLIVNVNEREIAQRAHSHGVLLWEITPQKASLEQVYMSMTSDSVEYRSSDPNAGLGSSAASTSAASTGGTATTDSASTDAESGSGETQASGGAHTASQPTVDPASTSDGYEPTHSTEHAPWNQEEK